MSCRLYAEGLVDVPPRGTQLHPHNLEAHHGLVVCCLQGKQGLDAMPPGMCATYQPQLQQRRYPCPTEPEHMRAVMTRCARSPAVPARWTSSGSNLWSTPRSSSVRVAGERPMRPRACVSPKRSETQASRKLSTKRGGEPAGLLAPRLVAFSRTRVKPRPKPPWLVAAHEGSRLESSRCPLHVHR